MIIKELLALIIPNSPEIICDYDLYFSRRPMGADSEFYLQEFPDKSIIYLLLLFSRFYIQFSLALMSGIWFKTIHIGENRLKTFMKKICSIRVWIYKTGVLQIILDEKL